VVFRAYFQALLDIYGAAAATQYELRAPGFMAMYLRREPHGSFVAESDDGTVVGVVFCVRWGEVGWFGSLGVSPEWQGRGAGQALIGRAIEFLEAGKCLRIGLETWPESRAMEHLYGKFGFVPCRATVKVSRAVAPAPAATAAAARPPAAAGGVPALDAGWSGRWTVGPDGADVARGGAAVRRIQDLLRASAPAEPAADYATEVAVPLEAGWAELLVLDGPGDRPAAFALAYVRAPSGSAVGALDVRLLVVAPGPDEVAALDAVTVACDARARALGLSSVTYDVNLRHARAAALLRERGFVPIYELLRMERPLDGFDPVARSRALECARWAG
jgi:GNAT superfamily N-acetyltransferase